MNLDVFLKEHREEPPVILTEFDLAELLAALRAGEFTERIRASLEWILQELIEAEATAKIGAGRYERSERRSTEGNGHRLRLLSTSAGGHSGLGLGAALVCAHREPALVEASTLMIKHVPARPKAASDLGDQGPRMREVL